MSTENMQEWMWLVNNVKQHRGLIGHAVKTAIVGIQ